MRVALPVIRLGKTQEENLDKVTHAIQESDGCDFIFFAETAISGLIPNDDASQMLPLGQEIPGAITSRISSACRNSDVWVSIGLLEREKHRLFDSVVIIDPSGQIVLKYRRISPRWHWSKSDPDVFSQGSEVKSVDTPFGRISTLICGDFFDEEGQIQLVKDLQPDFLHLPLVVSDGTGKAYTQEKWEQNDLPDYGVQVRKLGIPVFMVNYIDGDYCGGATVFSADGSVVASLPLWQEGILRCEI